MAQTVEQEFELPSAAERRKRKLRLSWKDRGVLWVMVGIPTIIHVGLVWVPTFLSIVLSFTRWDGLGGIKAIRWVGFKNYWQISHIYPPFWPAFRHNVIWLVFLIVFPTIFGLLLAVLLDKKIKFSRIYQSALYLPVMLSLAVVGFIWQLLYSPDEGLINTLTGHNAHNAIDFMGNSKINLYYILIAASWRHAGYIMVLYLAGLKSVDPSLREAAEIDGAGQWQTFRRVIFPTLRPINIVVLVVTVIESLRAFDIVYVINNGRNGLELLSVLVTQNIIGEASRVGYGSALAVILLILCVGFIITYVTNSFREKA